MNSYGITYFIKYRSALEKKSLHHNAQLCSTLHFSETTKQFKKCNFDKVNTVLAIFISTHCLAKDSQNRVGQMQVWKVLQIKEQIFTMK